MEIWPADQGEPARIAPASRLEGGVLVPGLVIELAEIWAVWSMLLPFTARAGSSTFRFCQQQRKDTSVARTQLGDQQRIPFNLVHHAMLSRVGLDQESTKA